MGRPCTTCSHKSTEAINNALRSGLSASSVGKRYGLTARALYRHFRDHVKTEAPSALALPAEAPVTPAVDVEPIRDAEAVHSQLEWIVAKSRSMHAEAEAAKDWRLANTAMTQIVNAVDKIAKSVGMYADGGTTINIDARTQKVAAFYDTLPDETLRRLASGEITIEAVMEATKAALA